MAVSESPIFPGKVRNTNAILASAAAATTVLWTAPTEGSIINSLMLYNAGTISRTIRFELKIGATTTVLWRGTTSTTQYEVINLITPSRLVGLDVNQPYVRLGNADVIQLVTEDTGAAAVHVSCFGGDYVAQ